MSDRHYLLKVMGLSFIPRLVTVGLTMISFPLMVRALGASQFGVVIFIGAITSVLESFVDFGVSSAAGKEVAAARETRTVSLDAVIRKWARLQATVALVGLVPLLGATYVVASASSNIEFSFRVLVILVFATWITISLNFVRACMTSVLAFKSLAALDVFESIFRSASWLLVAYRMPSTLGLALANVTTASCASILGAIVLLRFLNGHKATRALQNDELPSTHVTLSIHNMLKESLNFLWLRLATRVFSSIPTVAFGRMFGSELVGIIGAFAKIVELINFPFAVIGNALAVRAAGVVAKGSAAAKVLWDLVSRLIAVALMFSMTTYLGAEVIAKVLLPNTRGAGTIISILSITGITLAVSSVIGPMSDYVGALRSRNILLTGFAFVEALAIWLGAHTFGQIGAIVGYVLVLVLMNCGYVRIALGAFFPATRYHLRAEVSYFLTIMLAALFVTFLLHRALGLDHLASVHSFNVRFMDIAFLWLGVLTGLVLHQPAKKFFLTRVFFDFQTQNS
jgi:O-antigen/teichoic acid export membrane protein